MTNNKIETKEKKRAGENWGKPNNIEQKRSSKKVRKDGKEAIKKLVDQECWNCFGSGRLDGDECCICGGVGVISTSV